ncbi:MAG: hypothetical protein O3A84_10180 [Proteobacteria bacterium]|nr:hypothetical protein [Pseudomonadota bacterium]
MALSNRLAVIPGGIRDPETGRRYKYAVGAFDPNHATFFGRFPTKPGMAEPHAPTVALYRNGVGEFFIYAERRSAPERVLSTRPTHPITHGKVEVIDDVDSWLSGRMEKLSDWIRRECR